MRLDGIVLPLLVAVAAVVLSWAGRRYVQARNLAWIRDLAIALAIVGVTGSLQLAMGRSLVYSPGPVRLWVGDVNSDQNSQQVADPYTFTHVIHGALFYGLTHLVMGPASTGARMIVALAIESAWEAYENTDAVINRYRAATIALGYYGDSVLNSIADMVACLIGFVLASRLRWWWTVSWVVATEILLAIAIRDNLTLNILMLIHPFDAIRKWQMGA
ncbi:MAG TPA: DUF2585 family protein [Vicinamibacterales bacterium]